MALLILQPTAEVPNKGLQATAHVIAINPMNQETATSIIPGVCFQVQIVEHESFPVVVELAP